MEKQSPRRRPAGSLFQSRGAALLSVMAISVVIIAVLKEVWVSSQREHIASHQRLRGLRARYSAQSGMELSLIRLYAYKDAQRFLGKRADLARPYLDMIWRPPVSWPFPQPEDISESDKQALQKLNEESFLKDSYMAAVFPEDGRLDINNLSSPLEYLREFTFQTLLNLLILSTAGDEDEKYSEGDFIDILNNLADWTDKDDQSRSGGLESLIEDGARPLNRSFAFVGEIRKAPKVTEEIFQLLKPWITVYGARGLNVNYAEKPVLMALDIPEGLAEEILARTTIGSEFYQPFAGREGFCAFVRERGLDVCKNIESLYKTAEVLRFGPAVNFRAKGKGQSRDAVSLTEALLYDPAADWPAYRQSVKVQEKLIREELGEGAPKKASGSGRAAGKKHEKQKSAERIPGAPPFFVMYWKESL